MKKKLLYFFLLFLGMAYSQEYKKLINSSKNFAEIQAAAEIYFSEVGKGKGTGYKQYKRWEYNAKRLQSETGQVLSDSYYSKKYEEYNAILNGQRSFVSTSSGAWEQLGPYSWNATEGYTPGVGRITSMDIDPTDSDIMLIGAINGGVWKTTDNGSTWMPLGDQYSTMVVHEIVIDPNNTSTYYWGSGEGRVLKSTDAGATWSDVGTTDDFGDVNKIIINPNDSNLLFASSEGSGIFKSTDAGISWTLVIDNSEEESGFDVEFKPGDPNTLYASGNGFFKSTDGGDTWNQITSVFDIGPKMIAVSPANANVVYVAEAQGNGFSGLYVSTDSGDTFTKKVHTGKNFFGYETDASDLGEGQAPRDMGIAVSPTNINEVHLAGINTWRSLDGGDTFTLTAYWNYGDIPTIGYCHADIDDLIFYGNTLYVLSDGGIYSTADSDGAITGSFYTDKSTGLGIHQFYRIGVSQTAQPIVVGGAQDNGCSMYTSSTSNWINWLGADGMEAFVDKDNPNIIYGEQQNGTLAQSSDGGLTNELLNMPEPEGEWVTPFEQDPILSNTIYSGYTRVYKSTDQGVSWVPISQTFTAKLDHLKIASSNNNIMYAAHGTQLFKTTTGSGTWSSVSGVSGTINSIAIHPTNPDKVAVATTSADKVYVTSDGGTNWTVLNTALPNLAALALTWENNANNGLYLGMNYGVYYIDDTFTQWQPFSNLLPNIIVNELEINYADQKLYAATYGRGLWRTNLFSASTLSNENNINTLNTIKVFPNPASSKVSIDWNISNENTEVRIYDVNGKAIYIKKDVFLDNFNIDISRFSNGIYFLRINTSKGVYTQKLIID